MIKELDIILLTREGLKQAPPPIQWTNDLKGEFINARYFDRQGLRLFDCNGSYMILDTNALKLYGQIGERVFLELEKASISRYIDVSALDKKFTEAADEQTRAALLDKLIRLLTEYKAPHAADM